MKNLIQEKNLRILVIDDNRAIHEDFRKILCQSATGGGALADAEAMLFDAPANAAAHVCFEVDSAYQGSEALALVEEAARQGRPYALAFVDVRMPPGWDGVETTSRLWAACADLQIVICTAYSEYSWDEMASRLHSSDQLLILKKPFDSVEVLQLANALTEKWRLHQQGRLKVEELERIVEERTRVLRKTNENLELEIVERERAAQALRESEERYQLLFSKNPLPMVVYDAETLMLLAFNEATIRKYGYTAEELRSRSVNDIRVNPESHPAPAKPGEAPDTAIDSRLARHRKKDGAVIDVEIVSRPIVYGGRAARISLANDITERKAAEDRIREQATLLDLAHDAIFVRDMTGRIHFWNKGAERMYGMTAAEAVGKTIGEIFPHDFTGSLRAAETILLQTGEWSGEFRKQPKTGQEVVVDSRWTLLRNAQGEPQSILVINTDVTEKKKLEAQFLRSQRMEGIGTLATGMAHDLNNILAPILMSAGVLRWETTPEDKELAISRIESSVQRGAEIIQQVLTFGRGVSGERVAVNPGELIKEVSKICAQTFPKDVAVTLDLNAGVWPIIGDKTQLHQVLLNLSINARDAMPHGGSLVMRAENFMVDEAFASLHAPLQPGPYVRLEVADTGEGIPAANLEKIFEPFFTTKEFGKGTGLGLSTVLGIVKSHHGLVIVESEVNRGTTFKALLPASIAVAKPSDPGTSAGLPRGRGETILLVDDEANIVAATRRMLEQHGYKVLMAKHGREALTIFTRNDHPIDLVVTDIMMPGMDGIELIQALRGINPHVKIIAASGLGRDLAGGLRGKEMKALSIRTFLAKPYTAEKLLTALHGLLGKPQAANEKADQTPELTHG